MARSSDRLNRLEERAREAIAAASAPFCADVAAALDRVLANHIPDPKKRADLVEDFKAEGRRIVETYHARQ